MTLSDPDRRLARLFAACVLGKWDEVRAVRRAAVPPEPDRRWREALLQVHVFAGVPRAVEAYGVITEVGGLGEAAPEELGDAVDADARGQALFERIYQAGAAEVRAMLVRHHPDFARFVLEHAYARVLARDGLSADRRELLAVAALAAQGQERQLASHGRGAIRCGATRAELFDVLASLQGLIQPERAESARRVLERFAPS
jgi:alkylhydroperoxidase/carboxymuconolactone decarboxylase family protein YurZ